MQIPVLHHYQEFLLPSGIRSSVNPNSNSSIDLLLSSPAILRNNRNTDGHATGTGGVSDTADLSKRFSGFSFTGSETSDDLNDITPIDNNECNETFEQQQQQQNNENEMHNSSANINNIGNGVDKTKRKPPPLSSEATTLADDLDNASISSKMRFAFYNHDTGTSKARRKPPPVDSHSDDNTYDDR
ncbi:unnamed protein product [[Candida] boidinii]|nr:unnamed protein product [[Candida] boidinii]